METVPASAALGAESSSFIATPQITFDPPVADSLGGTQARACPAPRSVLIYSPQFNTIGGVETHVVKLSCRLADQKWNVTLVTTSGMLEEARVRELRSHGVNFICLPGDNPLSIARKAAWLAALAGTRLRQQHWDVVYTNAQGSLFWLLWPLRRRGTRFVHHYHTAGDERDESTWGWLFPKWLGSVDEIVACSTATAQNLRRVLGPRCLAGRHGREKLRVIRYLSAGGGSTPPREPRTAEGRLRFGFVGRVNRGKGIDVICQLSRDPKLAHIQWDIHGCGADYDAAFFDQFPNVYYHGRYNGAVELNSILSQLDALVLFSDYQEGQPISLIEGMSSGLPWIATDQGGTRELMWSPSNCRLLPARPSYVEARAAVMDLADAIRSGKTSCAAQRRAYDDHLAPEVLEERWIEFLAEDIAPRLAGGLLDNAFPAVKLR
jgi:glycosyltransferase involved in cell wall biosynthesis